MSKFADAKADWESFEGHPFADTDAERYWFYQRAIEDAAKMLVKELTGSVGCGDYKHNCADFVSKSIYRELTKK